MLSHLRLRLAAAAKGGSERGATAIEFGLLVALIAVAIVGAATLIGGSLDHIFVPSATRG